MLYYEFAFYKTFQNYPLIQKYHFQIKYFLLIYFYLNQYTHKYGNNGFLLSNQYVEKLPIKPYNNEIELENKVDLILENNKKLSSYKELLGRAKKNKKYDEIIDLEKLVEKTQDEIKKLDYEINQMVYKIYELTVNEIKIIENN